MLAWLRNWAAIQATMSMTRLDCHVHVCHAYVISYGGWKNYTYRYDTCKFMNTTNLKHTHHWSWASHCTRVPIGARGRTQTWVIFTWTQLWAGIVRLEKALLRESGVITPRCLQLGLYSPHACSPHAGLTVTIHLYTHYARPRAGLVLFFFACLIKTG